MIRVKKVKKIWVKKIDSNRGEWDYIKLESNKVKDVMDDHKNNPNPNFRLEIAPFHIVFKNNIYDFFTHNKTWDLIKMIIVFGLGFLGKYLYDIWF